MAEVHKKIVGPESQDGATILRIEKERGTFHDRCLRAMSMITSGMNTSAVVTGGLIGGSVAAVRNGVDTVVDQYSHIRKASTPSNKKT